MKAPVGSAFAGTCQALPRLAALAAANGCAAAFVACAYFTLFAWSVVPR